MPIVPHGTTTAEQPVHALRNADGEALEPTHQRRMRIGFHDEVEMVGLHRIVQHAERRRRCACEGIADDTKDT